MQRYSDGLKDTCEATGMRIKSRGIFFTEQPHNKEASMTVPLRFIATDSHISEYPVPVTFTRGTSLIIHEKYEGEEG